MAALPAPPAQPAAAPAPGSPRRHAVFHPLRVAAVQPLTDDSISITFDVPEDLRAAYDFAAGQHLSISCAATGDELRRSYSICTPAGSGILRVAVKRLPDGAFSTWACRELRPGDVLDVMTPVGRFGIAFDPALARSYAAVVAGSGMTPVLSIVATALAVEPRSRFTVIYGNRTTAGIMFLEELADLKNTYRDRLAVHHVLSREAQESPLLSGRIDGPRLRAFLDTLVPVDSVDEWFLCGPYGMVETARTVLTEGGADPRRLRSELFWARAAAAAAAGAESTGGAAATAPGSTAVTALLDGRATAFTMPQHGETLLEAALRARGDTPFACKGGVCGTCRTRVVSGRVRMDRNWALEQAEVDAGYVLACQSHPVTDTLTVDFDA